MEEVQYCGGVPCGGGSVSWRDTMYRMFITLEGYHVEDVHYCGGIPINTVDSTYGLNTFIGFKQICRFSFAFFDQALP